MKTSRNLDVSYPGTLPWGHTTPIVKLAIVFSTSEVKDAWNITSMPTC